MARTFSIPKVVLMVLSVPCLGSALGCEVDYTELGSKLGPLLDDPPGQAGAEGGVAGAANQGTRATGGTAPGGSAQCGDGVIDGREVCDDGNAVDGDGCPADCESIEAGFLCPAPGLPCIMVDACGDMRLGQDEACDDGNTVNGDGCSANCEVEVGWVCGPDGICTTTVCGDGIVAGAEECDDGSENGTSGCSVDCLLLD